MVRYTVQPGVQHDNSCNQPLNQQGRTISGTINGQKGRIKNKTKLMLSELFLFFKFIWKVLSMFTRARNTGFVLIKLCIDADC